jgi:hypothetical protein
MSNPIVRRIERACDALISACRGGHRELARSAVARIDNLLEAATDAELDALDVWIKGDGKPYAQTRNYLEAAE